MVRLDSRRGAEYVTAIGAQRGAVRRVQAQPLGLRFTVVEGTDPGFRASAVMSFVGKGI